VGLSALKQSLAAGHQCIALCRIPSKLTAIFPAETTPNLKIVEGNALDVSAVSQCLQKDGKLVDEILFTVGGLFIPTKLTVDDIEICRNGISNVLKAVAQLRSNGVTGQPYIIACSTTGISRFGRDIPLAMVPLYHLALKHPHQDKMIMENRLVESGEDFTIVRMSLLMGGESTNEIRVGIEDPKNGPESKAVGYSISKEDAGKWIAENILSKRDTKYLKKTASITY